MQPLSLTLKGFCGIRDGLGRDAITLDFERLADGAELVAIAGGNGRGKTTVMDNMHPYMTMPSRAAVAGSGGFSYYDHVYLPESEKDLVWAHHGRSYRSQVVIRANGRRKTEAFLFLLADNGAWKPVVLDDGTVSDGKVDTYGRCVEAICGSADTFFTSAFSAQGKRQLSAYRNGEIKTLLADLLGQEEVRTHGQRAAETVRLLKASLMAMRQELAGLDEQAERLGSESERLAGARDRMPRCLSSQLDAQAGLEAARSRHAALSALQAQSQGIEARRVQLLDEMLAANQSHQQALRTLSAQDRGEQQRLERLQQRMDRRSALERGRRQELLDRRSACLLVLAQGPVVQRATRRLPGSERILSALLAQSDTCREQVHRLAEAKSALRTAETTLAAILREAGQAAIRAHDLARRFGLANDVPCAGTPLLGRCQLLGDARQAQALMPSAQGDIQRLSTEKASLETELTVLRLQCRALAEAPQALLRAERRIEIARRRVAGQTRWAARAGEITQAQAGLEQAEQELAALVGAVAGQPIETEEEQAERRQVEASREDVARRTECQTQHHRAALDRIQRALNALQPAVDGRRLTAAKAAMEQAAQAAAVAEGAYLQALRDADALAALGLQAQALVARQTNAMNRIGRVETEISNWNLYARCMSNDGLIALAIDDAGPALSGLANDLLLACYGSRFTVAIHTLLETGKGDQKEGFDIVVHDGESGQSKSVGLMSGGEKVWVNEALVRAVALYLAQNTGRHYDALFSDEADGPLDVERKRMFMAMKREVLRLGGYRREFFVSQTPELTAMADVVIDLDAFLARHQAKVAA